ncbi:hypothetical protein [Vogesella indigofera]|uniref:hypothetical protein n=1 Tax=Vogesella indigofera TaxID=45465 RepID=UPI00234ED5D4|nr:hypothetical protein [Vogesella indigofera]MDC7710058.1 hypothetical protein [Vogesella indigofera]
MLSEVSLQSEAYGSTGNIGENFRRLLGAPALDPIQTVIREAVQNIADAATDPAGPKVFIRVRPLTILQQMVLQRHFFSSLPEEKKSREQLQQFLERANPVVLEICDFGTSGLGGPTRADRIPENEYRTDFIDFLRNIGTPRNVSLGGGTYGFGKVALYRVSRCSTIIVDSLVKGPPPGSRRLIGCHIGSSYEVPENGMRRQYTGRHWWGYADPVDGVVDPMLDADATKVATLLGFPERLDGQSGTSIMILDFDTEDQSHELIGRKIVETLLWNFWPRMLNDTPPEKRLSCRVEVDGQPVKIPRPEEIAPLHLFVKALRNAEQKSGSDVRKIVCQRPQKHLGNLAIEKSMKAPRQEIPEWESVFPLVSRHVALMRPVKLVVKYLEGQAFPDERIEWAGVFVADGDEEVERAFAESEPPAHDDWIPDNLPKGHAKTFVNVALRELKQAAFNMGAATRGHAPQSSAAPPLTKVASRLGAALAGPDGEGAGPNRKGTGTNGKRPLRAGVSKPLFIRLEPGSDQIQAVFRAEVYQDAQQSGQVLTAKASVAIDGAPANTISGMVSFPQVIGIRGVNGAPSSETDRVELNGIEGSFEIVVRMPPDAAVIVDANVSTGDKA